MHTTKVRLADGREAWAIHNSDWSGNAHVRWQSTTGEGSVAVPGEVLLALGRAAAHKAITDRLISALEQMAPPSVEAAVGASREHEVPTITPPEDARRLFGEPMYESDGAPSNASAAAIEALKMQRPVVAVKVGAEPAARTWTLAEIKAAWYRAEETGRPSWEAPRDPDDLRNGWEHVRGALTGEEV